MTIISKGIRWTVCLVLVFAGWKIVPVYAAALRFHFAVGEASKSGATGNLPAAEVIDAILLNARQLGLPVQPEAIEVQASGRVVVATVAYQVPVELGPRTVVLSFRARARESGLLVREDGGFEKMRKAIE